MENQFTDTIKEILHNHFGDTAPEILEKSQLLQYIELKTRSANKGAKARGSFANLYAIYVVVEDYMAKGFEKKSGYTKYDGAEFVKLFKRQRELPFGAKLQNHALNNRMNSEFLKSCVELQNIQNKNPQDVEKFILGLLAPNVDARLFEIVSYAILKYFYHDQKLYWGFEADKLKEDNLTLYKTGRTNANDGGIDFVMKPLGRFFQVTETLDVKKYFLDIDKIHKFPITFVVKSQEKPKHLLSGIKANALRVYSVKEIVGRYMQCIEEIINIPRLHQCFMEAVKQGYLKKILNEIVLQSKIEFNYEEEDDE